MQEPEISGGRASVHLGAVRGVGYRLQAKGILPRWNHSQRYGGAVAACVHVLVFEPRAQARIVDFRLALPEIRSQSTLDPKMIQLQFDGRDVLGKVAPDIIAADVDSRESLTFALRFYHHIHLLFILDEVSV